MISAQLLETFIHHAQEAFGLSLSARLSETGVILKDRERGVIAKLCTRTNTVAWDDGLKRSCDLDTFETAIINPMTNPGVYD